MKQYRLGIVPVAAVLACGGMFAAAPIAGAKPAPRFTNCTAMHKSYPHGVGKVGARDHVSGHTKPVTNFTRSNTLYAANKSSDRDHDGIACEAR